jgi:hypothetical protein
MLQAICRGKSRIPTVGSESVERCSCAASSEVERLELECLGQKFGGGCVDLVVWLRYY